jgi:hypothetical protein
VHRVLNRSVASESVVPPNQSLEPTLLSRILLRLALPLQHFKSSLATLRQPQGGSAPPMSRNSAALLFGSSGAVGRRFRAEEHIGENTP